MSLEEDIDLAGPNNQVPVASTKIDRGPAPVQFCNPGASDEDLINGIINVPVASLIPWQDCILPSRGLYYGWNEPTIKVRAMSQNDEKIMANQQLAQSGQSLNMMLQSCCQFPDGFGPADLLVGDYSFILYFIRGISYGQFYEFMLDCPACKQSSTHTYDLNTLVETITFADPALGGEPFRVDLPILTAQAQRPVWVDVRLLRMSDISNMVARGKVNRQIGGQSAARNKKQTRQQVQTQTADSLLNDNISQAVVSVNGVTDPFKIRAFCANLHASDSSAIRSWLTDHSPGIDTSIVTSCPECGQDFTVGLPITETFFRSAKGK